MSRFPSIPTVEAEDPPCQTKLLVGWCGRQMVVVTGWGVDGFYATRSYSALQSFSGLDFPMRHNDTLHGARKSWKKLRVEFIFLFMLPALVFGVVLYHSFTAENLVRNRYGIYLLCPVICCLWLRAFVREAKVQRVKAHTDIFK